MPETRALRALRMSLARATTHQRRNPHDPTAGRALDAARRAYLEARAVAAMDAAVTFVAGLDLDDEGRDRVVAAVA